MVLYGSNIIKAKNPLEKGVSEGKKDISRKRPKPLSKKERLKLIRQIAEDRGMLRHREADQE